MTNIRVVTTAGIYMIEKVENAQEMVKKLTRGDFVTARPVVGGINREVTFQFSHIVAIEVLEN